MQADEQNSKLNGSEQIVENPLTPQFGDLLGLSDSELGAKIREYLLQSGNLPGYSNTVANEVTKQEEQKIETMEVPEVKEETKENNYNEVKQTNRSLFKMMDDMTCLADTLYNPFEFSLIPRNPFFRHDPFLSRFRFNNLENAMNEMFGDDRMEIDELENTKDTFGYSKSMYSQTSVVNGIKKSESVSRTKKNINGKVQVHEKRITEDDKEIVTEETRPDGQKVTTKKSKISTLTN